MWGEVQLVTRLRPVLASESDRVETKVGRDVLHVGLEAEEGLRSAIAPVGAGYRNIGVGNLAVEALERSVVRGEAAQASNGLHGEAVGSEGTGIADKAHLLGHQCAVVVDAGPVGHRLWVSGPAGDEFFFAREL